MSTIHAAPPVLPTTINSTSSLILQHSSQLGQVLFFKSLQKVKDKIDMKSKKNSSWYEKYSFFKLIWQVFIFRHASVFSTYPCQSVGPSVRNTFEFPFYQRLWLLYVKKLMYKKFHTLPQSGCQIEIQSVIFVLLVDWGLQLRAVNFTQQRTTKSPELCWTKYQIDYLIDRQAYSLYARGVKSSNMDEIYVQLAKYKISNIDSNFRPNHCPWNNVVSD